jgi:DDE family transposase
MGPSENLSSSLKADGQDACPRFTRDIRCHLLLRLEKRLFLAASTRWLSALANGLLPFFRRFRLSGLWHRIFTILRVTERKRIGKDPNSSAAIVDSQSVKATEESAGWKGYEAHSNGYDAYKNVKGRKRHLLVDTLGLPLSIYVTPADVQDRAGARCLCWLDWNRWCLVW